MSGIFDPLRDLIKAHADESRPLRPAVVEDTSRWSDTGAAYISARFAGGLGQNVAYRDGREPLVGETVYIAKADAGHAPYIALPLPLPVVVGALPCTIGQFYASARNLTTGAWDILLCDLSITIADAPVWVRKGASPVPAGFDRYPLVAVVTYTEATKRLLTWGTDAGMTTGSDLWYSDDFGATWFSAGLANVIDVDVAGFFGELYAVSPATVFRSEDYGASWGVAYGPPPDGSAWRHCDGGGHSPIVYPPLHPLGPASDPWDFRWNGRCWLVSTSGHWLTRNRFAHYFTPFKDSANTTLYQAGGWSDVGSDTWLWTGPFIPPKNTWLFKKAQPDIYGPFFDPPAGAPAALNSNFYRAGAGDALLATEAGYVAAWVAAPTYGAHPFAATTYARDDLGDVAWFTDGDFMCCGANANGAEVANFGADGGARIFYRQPEHHPHGLTGVGIADACLAWPTDLGAGCLVVALTDDADDVATHTKFCISHDIPNYPVGGGESVGATVFAPIDGRLVADLGANYVASVQGLTTLTPAHDDIP